MGFKKVMGKGIMLMATILIAACGEEKSQPAPTRAQPTFSSYHDYREYVDEMAVKVSRLGNVIIDRTSLFAGDQSDVLTTIENLYAVHQKYDMKLKGYVQIKFASKRQMTDTSGVVVLNYGASETDIEKFLSAQPTQAEWEQMRREVEERKRQEQAAQAAQAAEEARRREEANRPRRNDFGRP